MIFLKLKNFNLKRLWQCLLLTNYLICSPSQAIPSTHSLNAQDARKFVSHFYHFMSGVNLILENVFKNNAYLLKACERSDIKEEFDQEFCYYLESSLTLKFVERQVAILKGFNLSLSYDFRTELDVLLEAYKTNKSKTNDYVNDRRNATLPARIFKSWGANRQNDLLSKIAFIPNMFTLGIFGNVPTSLANFTVAFRTDNSNKTIASLVELVRRIHSVYVDTLFPPAETLRCPIDYGVVAAFDENGGIIQNNFINSKSRLVYSVKVLETGKYGAKRESYTKRFFYFERSRFMNKSDFFKEAGLFGAQSYEKLNPSQCSKITSEYSQGAKPITILMTPFRQLDWNEFTSYANHFLLTRFVGDHLLLPEVISL